MFSSHLDMAPFSMSHPSIFCKPPGNTLSCVETTQCAANEQRLLCLVGSVGSRVTISLNFDKKCKKATGF